LKPTGAIGPPQIHGFSDAGEQAYGAVIFLQWQLEDCTGPRSSHHRAVHCASKEEEYPQIRIAWLSSSSKDLRYLSEDFGLSERQRTKEIPMGRFHNRIILGNNPPRDFSVKTCYSGPWTVSPRNFDSLNKCKSRKNKDFNKKNRITIDRLFGLCSFNKKVVPGDEGMNQSKFLTPERSQNCKHCVNPQCGKCATWFSQPNFPGTKKEGRIGDCWRWKA
jgi:hypothetical protein